MLFLPLLACAPTATLRLEEPFDTATPASMPMVGTRFQICFYGATEPNEGANPEIHTLCSGFPNLIRNESANLPGFRIYEGDQAEAAMLASLDTDGDGLVTQADTAIIDVVGYSWGGATTTLLNLHALDAVRIDRPVIGRVAIIDPFIPPRDEPLVVAGQAEAIWSYGHSLSPVWDCSTFAPLGPYRARPIDCSNTPATCREYDLSLDRDVGHCSIVGDVVDWARSNVLDGTSPAPDSLLR